MRAYRGDFWLAFAVFFALVAAFEIVKSLPF